MKIIQPFMATSSSNAINLRETLIGTILENSVETPASTFDLQNALHEWTQSRKIDTLEMLLEIFETAGLTQIVKAIRGSDLLHPMASKPLVHAVPRSTKDTGNAFITVTEDQNVKAPLLNPQPSVTRNEFSLYLRVLLTALFISVIVIIVLIIVIGSMVAFQWHLSVKLPMSSKDFANNSKKGESIPSTENELEECLNFQYIALYNLSNLPPNSSYRAKLICYSSPLSTKDPIDIQDLHIHKTVDILQHLYQLKTELHDLSLSRFQLQNNNVRSLQIGCTSCLQDVMNLFVYYLCPGLEHIYIEDTSGVNGSSSHLMEILSSSLSLRTLNITTSDVLLDYLFTGTPLLRVTDLEVTHQLHSDAIMDFQKPSFGSLCTKFPNLTNLSSTYWVLPISVLAGCSSLVKVQLHIPNGSMVGLTDMQFFVREFPHLQVLHMTIKFTTGYNCYLNGWPEIECKTSLRILTVISPGCYIKQYPRKTTRVIHYDNKINC